jgi:hypothetical protein
MLAGAALLLGIASVFGFAPFGAWAVSLLALAGLFVLWQRAATPRAAAWLGYAYGIGLFGAGTSWTYVALSTFGGRSHSGRDRHRRLLRVPRAVSGAGGLDCRAARAGGSPTRLATPRAPGRSLSGCTAQGIWLPWFV